VQIRLEIAEAEIRALQETSAEKSPKPRLSFEEWAGREIASLFQGLFAERTVGSTGYVAVSVCARNSAATLGHVSGLIIACGDHKSTTAAD
jgi:hypothetical protein